MLQNDLPCVSNSCIQKEGGKSTNKNSSSSANVNIMKTQHNLLLQHYYQSPFSPSGEDEGIEVESHAYSAAHEDQGLSLKTTVLTT